MSNWSIGVFSAAEIANVNLTVVLSALCDDVSRGLKCTFGDIFSPRMEHLAFLVVIVPSGSLL